MTYVNTLFTFVCSQLVSFLLMYLIEFTYRLLQHVKNITENVNLRVSIIINWHLHSVSSVCNKHRKNEKNTVRVLFISPPNFRNNQYDAIFPCRECKPPPFI